MPTTSTLELTLPAAALSPPAATAQVRPGLVLPEAEARALLTAARAADVSRGGPFCAGPAGVQVWTGPFDGPQGSRGTAEHLGSVDWSYDTPNRHYVTIYRVMVTAAGLAAGQSTNGLLARVLSLSGAPLPPVSLGLAVPPPRDPFRPSR